MRLKLEAKLQSEIRAIFRKYLKTVVNFFQASGLVFLSQDFRSELRQLLLRHYWRVARQFRNHARSNNSKYYQLSLETKVTKQQLEQNIDQRIQTRLEEYFTTLAEDRANKLTYTTESEISNYVRKIYAKFANDGILLDRSQVTKRVRELYISRINSRAKSVAITETTRTMEATKLVEIEELIDELDDDQLDELSAENVDREELIAEIEEMLAAAGAVVDIDASEIADSLSNEEIVAAGGIAAILAAITIQKTWVATLDEATREAHADADGQQVGLDETFDVDGEDLEFPGDDSGSPENVINCRCSVLYGVE